MINLCKHHIYKLDCKECRVPQSKCLHPDERISGEWVYHNDKLHRASGFCRDCGTQFRLNADRNALEPENKKGRAAKYDGHVHVMPLDKEHKECADCWCGPELEGDYTEEGGKKLYVHRETQ